MSFKNLKFDLKKIPLCVFLATSLSSTAETFNSTNIEPYQPGSIVLEPFRYIPPPSAVDADHNKIQRKPEEQKIVDLYAAGKYREAGLNGLELLENEKPDDALKLIMANSLAWTGQTTNAKKIYQEISEPKLIDDANLGVANILRWQGDDHLAAPIFRDILERRPDSSDVQTGLLLAERELAPRTLIGFGGIQDSGDFSRNSGVINHRWRGNNGYTITEIELGAIKDTLPTVGAQQNEVTLRHQDLALQLKPAFEISLPKTSGNSNSKIYGNLKLTFDDDKIRVGLGKVNWGRMANNAESLRQDFSADYIGANIKREFYFGEIAGRLDYYKISDGNVIVSGGLRLNSNLRPLGAKIRPIVGVDIRKSKFSTPNYWSPADGHGNIYAGLEGDWAVEQWAVYGGAQFGLPAYGEAGTSWSLSAGAKRWLTDDVAFSFNLWSMASVRAGVTYRSQSANMMLERFWR